MSKEKLVVTVSVTGGMGDINTPNIPVTPKQIAQSAVEAGKAGASVAHIHVRDLETGHQSMKFELYKEVFDRIRDNSDILINLTTGSGARIVPDNKDPIGFAPGTTLCTPEKRLEHVLILKPELCSLDIGSLDFGRHVFVNYIEHVEWMAEQIKEARITPELEVFTLGHIEIAKHLIDTGRVKKPTLFQLCMGIPWGIPANTFNMTAMVNALPDDSMWAGFGISAKCFPMLAQSVILGGNVRIGLEDTLYLERGVKAKSNGELVEKAVSLIRLFGKEPASPSETKELFGLS
jgi:uncharacterized protein (DUF849 family)